MDNESQTTQKNLNLGSYGKGGTRAIGCEACNCSTAGPDNLHLTSHLMEQIIKRDNLNRAYFRVTANKGAAGIDGMKVDELLQVVKQFTG